jgi:hypothetical protein
MRYAILALALSACGPTKPPCNAISELYTSQEHYLEASNECRRLGLNYERCDAAGVLRRIAEKYRARRFQEASCR